MGLRRRLYDWSGAFTPVRERSGIDEIAGRSRVLQLVVKQMHWLVDMEVRVYRIGHIRTVVDVSLT